MLPNTQATAANMRILLLQQSNPKQLMAVLLDMKAVSSEGEGQLHSSIMTTGYSK